MGNQGGRRDAELLLRRAQPPDRRLRERGGDKGLLLRQPRRPDRRKRRGRLRRMGLQQQKPAGREAVGRGKARLRLRMCATGLASAAQGTVGYFLDFGLGVPEPLVESGAKHVCGIGRVTIGGITRRATTTGLAARKSLWVLADPWPRGRRAAPRTLRRREYVAPRRGPTILE
jgi:hypothetical protein